MHFVHPLTLRDIRSLRRPGARQSRFGQAGANSRTFALQNRLGNMGLERMLGHEQLASLPNGVRRSGGLFDRVSRRSLSVATRAHPLEQEAERCAASGTALNGRPSPLHLTRSASNRPGLGAAGGPLPEAIRQAFQPRFGRELDAVRIHRNQESAQAAALLGAQAFTHGRDIFLGERASVHDRALMAHELSHACQNQDLVQLREATWLERRAWLAFFDHYLPRKFLNNYMDDTGNPITLTATEMQDCNPIVDLRRSRAFMAELTRLKAAGGGTSPLSITGWGGALTNGTLGNFTIHYDGVLSVAPSGDWTFSGTMWFEDYWDFNTGGANRPVAAEVKVRVANALLPGSPFPIDSVAAPVSQTHADARASWTAAAPTHVPDRMARTGADIEVGAAGGETLGAPAGADVEIGGAGAGGEFGAQSSEDLN